MKKIPNEVLKKAIDAFLLTGHVSEIIADIFEDGRRRIDMQQKGLRYCTLTDGTVLRNRTKKPLLHNGGKPR